MNSNLLLGIKFFDEFAHLDDFMKGNIFFSTSGSLSLGNNSEMNYNEFAVPIYKQELKINGCALNPSMYSFYYEWQKHVPLFCFYTLDEKNYINDGSTSTIMIDSRFSIEGKKRFAAIFELSDFMNRLDIACQKKDCGYQLVKTKYFDFSSKNDEWLLDTSQDMYGFLKIHDSKHDYQNESRVILTDMLSEKPFLLPIGAWRNIPLQMKVQNNKWHLFN